VSRRWAHLEAVFIANNPEDFASSAGAAMALSAKPGRWLEEIDRELSDLSWDRTWQSMWRLINEAASSPRVPAHEITQ
jgi:hypothetical protein